MSYVSLYRKYRSQGFDEILGQKHVTQTLKNALSSGKIAHAYLFTGPRGTGKTSTARVLAKALNCLQAEGPTPAPCGTCAACERIRDGHSMDVMEIDAASTRGIDDIRDLREKVKFAPAEERFKVYVIDEVHQLTGEAFNALLKTLEEPPRNVVFVLATTELHKVPATILSRCQRFDFRRGSLDDLRGRIQSACDAEGWSITPEAVAGLALAANGGYRDALSLLEQVAAFATETGTIDLDSVNTVLGSAGQNTLFAVADAVAGRDPAACFRLAGEAMAEGVEVRQFLGGLRKHFRDILMAGVGASPEETATTSDEQRSRLKQQFSSLSLPTVLWCIDQLNEAERDLRWAPQQRLLMETTLVKLATVGSTAPSPGASAVAPATVSPVPAAPAPRRAPARPAPILEEAPPLDDVPPGIAAPSERPPVTSTETGPDDFEELSAAWKTMIGKVGPSTRVILESMRPVRLDGHVLVVSGDVEFNVEKANKQKGKLEVAFENAIHRKVGFLFIYEPGSAPESTAPTKQSGSRSRSKPVEVSLEDLAMQTFDATPVTEEPITPDE